MSISRNEFVEILSGCDPSEDGLLSFTKSILEQDGQASEPLTLGEYVLLEKLGADGGGVVFKAEHRRIK